MGPKYNKYKIVHVIHYIFLTYLNEISCNTLNNFIHKIIVEFSTVILTQLTNKF